MRSRVIQLLVVATDVDENLHARSSSPPRGHRRCHASRTTFERSRFLRTGFLSPLFLRPSQASPGELLHSSNSPTRHHIPSIVVDTTRLATSPRPDSRPAMGSRLFPPPPAVANTRRHAHINLRCSRSDLRRAVTLERRDNRPSNASSDASDRLCAFAHLNGHTSVSRLTDARSAAHLPPPPVSSSLPTRPLLHLHPLTRFLVALPSFPASEESSQSIRSSVEDVCRVGDRAERGRGTLERDEGGMEVCAGRDAAGGVGRRRTRVDERGERRGGRPNVRVRRGAVSIVADRRESGPYMYRPFVVQF